MKQRSFFICEVFFFLSARLIFRLRDETVFVREVKIMRFLPLDPQKHRFRAGKHPPRGKNKPYFTSQHFSRPFGITVRMKRRVIRRGGRDSAWFRATGRAPSLPPLRGGPLPLTRPRAATPSESLPPLRRTLWVFVRYGSYPCHFERAAGESSNLRQDTHGLLVEF